MALSWTSTLQDLVALTVVQKAYTDLRTHEKTYLDGTASVPTSAPGGVAGQALNVVGQYAQWFSQAGASAANAPSVWEHVLVAEAALRFAQGIKPQDVPQHRANVSAAWQAAMESYSIADASANTLNDASVTVQMIRFHVLRHCIRRGRGRRVLIQVPDIDNAINWAIDYIWNFGAWKFRTRHVTMTMTKNTITVGGSSGTFTLTYGGATGDALAYNCTAAQIETELDTLIGSGIATVTGSSGSFTITYTSGVSQTLGSTSLTGTCTVTITESNTPTFDLPSGETYHSFVSQNITIKTPTSNAGRLIKMVNAQQFNEIKASPFIWSTASTTAAPRYFWIEHRSDGTKCWWFWPQPDTTYTAYATVTVAQPSYPATITATTAFDKFPPSMRRLFPDFVLAKCMRQYGVEGWETVEANAKDQLVKIAPDYDTDGAAEWGDGVGTTDVYQDGYLKNRGL